MDYLNVVIDLGGMQHMLSHTPIIFSFDSILSHIENCIIFLLLSLGQILLAGVACVLGSGKF